MMSFQIYPLTIDPSVLSTSTVALCDRPIYLIMNHTYLHMYEKLFSAYSHFADCIFK